MSKILNFELVERLFFTTIVIGILMAGIGFLRFVDLSSQISNNEAAQIHASGEEVAPQSNAEVRGLVASDMELRRLISERFNMMVVGGIGLALIGVGWIVTDIIRGRRKKRNETSTTMVEATS